MNIFSVPPSPAPKPSETNAAPARDVRNDGDADDAPRARAYATPPPGVGTRIDTTA